jgi:minimal PKS chain-length factor (CLF/KS beta)
MITSLPDPTRRAVITGMGAIAPNGIGLEAWWRATLRGESGIRRISRFDPAAYATQFAGEIEGFDPEAFIERRLMVQTDRWTWLGLAATEMALADAALDPRGADPYSMSAITASSSGGNEFGQVEIQKLWASGPRHVGAYQSIAWFYAATTGQISIRHGLKGSSSVVVTEGAGGLDALAQSRRTIRRGMTAIVSGGMEAPLSPYALTCQLQNGRLSSRGDAAAFRPFDRGASGYLPGEGGAILLVENRDDAVARKAPTIYGEIAGYAATHDACHASRPPSDARQLARAIRLALADAGMQAANIDAVFADGSGEPGADALEVQALRSVFGERAATLPVTAPKSMVGRLYAGGAALDVAGALLALRDQVLPPTINLDVPVTDEVDFVGGRARSAELRAVLVVARGHGGFNSAMVLRRDA